MYIKGVQGASEIRATLSRVSSYQELETILYDFKSQTN
jgi:hypothetical protein